MNGARAHPAEFRSVAIVGSVDGFLQSLVKSSVTLHGVSLTSLPSVVPTSDPAEEMMRMNALDGMSGCIGFAVRDLVVTGLVKANADLKSTVSD